MSKASSRRNKGWVSHDFLFGKNPVRQVSYYVNPDDVPDDDLNIISSAREKYHEKIRDGETPSQREYNPLSKIFEGY